MDESVFESNAWKWLSAKSYTGRFIASGSDAASGKTPPTTDIMPFIPTGLLLARRVSLSGNWGSDLATSFSSHTSGGASLGWGPFSFGGRYQSDDASTYHKATAAGNTLSWNAPQIIGFFVQVLPRDPTPSQCYHFASDTKPLPAACSQFHNLFVFNRWDPQHVTVSSSILLDRAKSQLRNSLTAKTLQP